MIHDLIPLHYPHFVPAGYDTFISQYIGDLSWLADGFLCISDRSRQELDGYFSDQGRPRPPAAVITLGSNLSDTSAMSSGNVVADKLTGLSSVLYVSTIEARKNHRTLYEAWDYGMRNGLLDPHKHRLVFAGRVGWNVGDLLGEIRNNPATKDTVLILNDLDDGQLRQLYQQAAFAVFPSFAEGFGLPVVECLALGKMCIASEGLPLPIQHRDLVPRLEAMDTMSWAQLISSFLNHPEKVSEMENRIRAEYRPVTWDSSAEIFFSRFQELEAGSRRV
jgi:glycosyltransferase involved in cell wall biosynthesis